MHMLRTTNQMRYKKCKQMDLAVLKYVNWETSDNKLLFRKLQLPWAPDVPTVHIFDIKLTTCHMFDIIGIHFLHYFFQPVLWWKELWYPTASGVGGLPCFASFTVFS